MADFQRTAKIFEISRRITLNGGRRQSSSKGQEVKKILYLDFDGVLHDEDVYYHPRRGIYIKTPGRVLFEWMPILDELLRPHPEIEIVLSTSWVRVRSFSFAKKQLSAALQARVIGATFHSREMWKEAFAQKPRGVQIADDVLRRGPTAWFAIDDEHLDWPEWCRSHLVRTEGAYGISAASVQNAIRRRLKQL